jgi:seryl-tRNA synthetase
MDWTKFKDAAHFHKIKDSQRKRYASVDLVDEIKTLIDRRTVLVHTLDGKNKASNGFNKKIAGLMKKKKREEMIDEEHLKQLIQDKAHLKTEQEELKAQFGPLEEKIRQKCRQVGNFVHPSVPVGQDEEKCNETVRTWKDPAPPTPQPLHHHHELLEKIGGYAPVPGAAIAGHRGYFLTGVGVLLNQALINYGLDFLMRKHFTPIQPPFFMNKDIMSETAQLEQFDEELYKVMSSDKSEDDKYLIATSEQPISAYYRNQWIDASTLPIKFAGFSTCFRKEAGGHGKDAWGIFRTHQFEKIEQFVITAPDQSWNMHEEMIKVSEEFYQSLELPYRVVNICSGALNNAASKKYDLEAWFPTLGVWRELVSCSNCTDYQSRVMNIRTKISGQNAHVHMLNSTLCATGRTICCILENYQTPEGIVVPAVLQSYLHRKFIPFTG